MLELIGVAAALGAALCWTLASALWRRLPTSLGPAQLNLLKNLVALGFQLPLLVVLGQLDSAAARPVQLLLLSGVLGIALGDSFYFAALRRLGTRRTLTFDAGGPAVTASAGAVLLAEVPAPRQWLGIGLISLAVLLVARQKPSGSEVGLVGRQQTGILCALAALLCGGGGALLARAALRDTLLSPLHAATIRLGGAALVLLPLLWRLPPPAPTAAAPLARAAAGHPARDQRRHCAAATGARSPQGRPGGGSAGHRPGHGCAPGASGG